jgi:hypothetical protein
MTTKHSPEVWTVDDGYDGYIRGGQADMYPNPILFERVHATEADVRLAAAAPALLEALRSVFEHCALVHKHWGEGCNQRQADAAIAGARALLDSLS